MQLYSTNNYNGPTATLKEAVLNGLATDGGLYMPTVISAPPWKFFESLHQRSLQEIALDISTTLFGDDIPRAELKRLIDTALNFDLSLVVLNDRTHVLELFHGPTLAFKDFGARFMAQLMSYFVASSDRELVVLVATSGDTGSAVASGFLGVPGIRVVILYPSGKVSHLQEQQLTTMGDNIQAVEVQGTFDDCQRLVKEAFVEPELASKLWLTSANSINIARLIPQSFYYFWAYGQLGPVAGPVAISVPCGNFGNLTAGLIAKRMGLPIDRFIAATNRNDVVGQYLKTGQFTPRPSHQTISNAMDVGNPSNFARMLELFDHNVELMRRDITSSSFTDDQTRQAIGEVYHRYHYTLDPHGAVAYLGLSEFLSDHPDHQGIFFETAHPAKFPEVVEAVIGQPVPIPDRLASYQQRTKQATLLPNQLESLKEFLVTLNRENI